MAVGSDTVDLFVVGADFYSGSTIKKVKNGWCELGTLGLGQAKWHFGNACKLGTVWYFAKRVPRGELRSFEERARQDIWLRAQSADVARIIIDSGQRTKRPDALVAGREFQFRTEAEAVSALQGSVLAPAAMVISAGVEQHSLLTFLDERYHRQRKILVPPHSETQCIGGEHRLSTDALESACLRGSENDNLWKEYERSRADKALAARWLKEVSDSDKRRWLNQLLRGRLPRNPKDWLGRVHADPTIVARVNKEIEPFLKCIGKDNKRLAGYDLCIEFIAGNLIRAVALEIIAEQETPTLSATCDSAKPAFEVILHDRFILEYRAMSENVGNELRACIELLKRSGPQLDRPRVGQLDGSRYSRMKELRFHAAGGVWRVAFAFDPNRQAILLVADNKSGWSSEDSFYRQLIQKADERFGAHLKKVQVQQHRGRK
jgi:hypothetical protein